MIIKKPLNFIVNLLLNIINITYGNTKSRIPSPNLIFLESNMAIERPHSRRQRYQCKCPIHSRPQNMGPNELFLHHPLVSPQEGRANKVWHE
jgi:hypothetical protein